MDQLKEKKEQIEETVANKLKDAKSIDEVKEIAAKEGYELSDEQLEGIAGGIDMPELPDERIDCHGFFIS